MSNSQGYEAVTASSDGVRVSKRFEADEFPVPAIAFNFESERTEPVTVRLSDAVPDGIEVEDLGFHPEYGSEYWSIEDEAIFFEREFEPDSEYTTVYGIRATGTDDVEQFLTEPSIEQVDPPIADEERPLVADGNDAVEDVIRDDVDTVSGLDAAEDSEGDDEEVEPLDLKDPSTGDTTSSGVETGSDPTSDSERVEDSESATGDGGSGSEMTGLQLTDDTLVGALAAELRTNDVDEEDVRLLRQAFELASEGSVRARVDKLQDDVTDVVAYADALEEFLDENGTGDELIDGFQTEIEQFRERVEGFDEELDSIQTTMSANEEAVSSLTSEFESVERQIEDVEGRIEELREELESIDEDLGEEDIGERIDAIDDDIEELKTWREQLSSVISGGGE